MNESPVTACSLVTTLTELSEFFVLLNVHESGRHIRPKLCN